VDFHVLSSDSVTASDTTVGAINVTRFAGVVLFTFENFLYSMCMILFLLVIFITKELFCCKPLYTIYGEIIPIII
jgi:hypothetical protein